MDKKVKLKDMIKEDLRINKFVKDSSVERLKRVKHAFKKDANIIKLIDQAIKLIEEY